MNRIYGIKIMNLKYINFQTLSNLDDRMDLQDGYKYMINIEWIGFIEQK